MSCSFCENVFEKKNSHFRYSKTGRYFCDRACKAKAQKLSFGLKDVWPSHYGSGTNIPDLVKTVCVSCGCAKPWQLVIHHIDGNRANNVESNLEIVCANCHCDRHTKLIKGVRIFDSKVLTPREDL